MIPPSSNHYKAYKIIIPRDPRQKAFAQWYLTPEALDFYGCVQMIAAGRYISGPELEVSFIVFLPAGRRYDVDNYPKCILDSLKHCKVIRDDIDVDDLHCHRRRDPLNPRTVIVIKSAQAQLEGI
jgi:Holliday junction resolvase RusA-like endonuclease